MELRKGYINKETYKKRKLEEDGEEGASKEKTRKVEAKDKVSVVSRHQIFTFYDLHLCCSLLDVQFLLLPFYCHQLLEETLRTAACYIASPSVSRLPFIQYTIHV